MFGEIIFVSHFGETDPGPKEADRFSLPTLPGGIQQRPKSLAGGGGGNTFAGGAGEIGKFQTDKNLPNRTRGCLTPQVIQKFVQGRIKRLPARFESLDIFRVGPLVAEGFSDPMGLTGRSSWPRQR